MTERNISRGALNEYWRDPVGLLYALADDVEAVMESDYDYTWNMEVWHTPNGADDDNCEICLAGAMIVGQIGGDPKVSYVPESFGWKTHNALNAVDSFRRGNPRAAMDALGFTVREVMAMYDAMEEAIGYQDWIIEHDRGRPYDCQPVPAAIRDLAGVIQNGMEAAGVKP